MLLDDPHGSPNFFVDIPAPLDAESLASLVVDTFVGVLQMPYPNDLTYETWGHEGPNELPELKLTDEDRPAPSDPLPPPELEPETPESVRAKVRAIIQQLTGDGEVAGDDDGDFSLQIGSARVFVRVMDDMPALAIFSTLLTEVDRAPAAMLKLNEMNANLRFVKLMLVGNSIVGVLRLADDLDNQLQADIGGTLSTGERLPSQERPTAGYL